MEPIAASAECFACEGTGKVSCCQSAENGIFGGPHGCRCRRPGSRTCFACDGAGTLFQCPRCQDFFRTDGPCRRCTPDEDEAEAPRTFRGGVFCTALAVLSVVVYGFAVYGFLAWWRS